ncbi:hypothetical protein AMECASPLE_034553 [Ameca splendens]|uniref:Uncharacterized protein n=1 Tax=Ameca splendens TaxID=208324 RepID=A0ABV1AEF8_9TELE
MTTTGRRYGDGRDGSGDGGHTRRGGAAHLRGPAAPGRSVFLGRVCSQPVEQAIFVASMPLKLFYALSALVRFDDWSTRAERRPRTSSLWPGSCGTHGLRSSAPCTYRGHCRRASGFFFLCVCHSSWWLFFPILFCVLECFTMSCCGSFLFFFNFNIFIPLLSSSNLPISSPLPSCLPSRLLFHVSALSQNDVPPASTYPASQARTGSSCGRMSVYTGRPLGTRGPEKDLGMRMLLDLTRGLGAVEI